MAMEILRLSADPDYNAPLSALPVTDTDVLVLAANVATRYTIPDGAEFLRLTSSVVGGLNPVVALFGGAAVTAAVPIADIIDGTSPMMLPLLVDGLLVKVPDGATHVSFVCAAVSMVFISRWRKG